MVGPSRADVSYYGEVVSKLQVWIINVAHKLYNLFAFLGHNKLIMSSQFDSIGSEGPNVFTKPCDTVV